MSLEKIDEIDSIGIDQNTGEIIMSIIDSRDWAEEESHLLQLQEKINSYLRFIESDEIYEVYPKSIGRKIVIKVYTKYELTYNAKMFIQKVNELIKSLGLKLIYEVIITEDL